MDQTLKELQKVKEAIGKASKVDLLPEFIWHMIDFAHRTKSVDCEYDREEVLEYALRETNIS